MSSGSANARRETGAASNQSGQGAIAKPRKSIMELIGGRLDPALAEQPVSLHFDDFLMNEKRAIEAQVIIDAFPCREPEAFRLLREPRVVDGFFLIRQGQAHSAAGAITGALTIGLVGWSDPHGVANRRWATPSIGSSPDCAATLSVSLSRETDILTEKGCANTWWLDFSIDGLAWDRFNDGSLKLLNAAVAQCLTDAIHAATTRAQDQRLSINLGVNLHGVLESDIAAAPDTELSERDFAMKTVEATLLAKIADIALYVEGDRGPIRSIILSNDIHG